MEYLVFISNSKDNNLIKSKFKNKTTLMSIDELEKSYNKLTSNDDILVYFPTKLFSKVTKNNICSLEKVSSICSLSFIDENLNIIEQSSYIISMLNLFSVDSKNDLKKSDKIDRLPNYVFGYDKTIGSNKLTINIDEAEIVKEIFEKYSSGSYGTNKLANELNAKKIHTKRNGKWSQVAISRVLSNSIYCGVYNSTNYPELKIIDSKLFEAANNILSSRKSTFSNDKKTSTKHVFSSLIKCKHCGATFRRQVRTYKNEYVRWVCSGRNANGTDFCPNISSVDEEEFSTSILEYFSSILEEKDYIKNIIATAFNEKYSNIENSISSLQDTVLLLKTKREKTLDLYYNGMISSDDISNQITIIDQDIETNETKISELNNIHKISNKLDNYINGYFKSIEKVVKSNDLTNDSLSKIINKMVVDKNSNVEIVLTILKDLDLPENLI